MPTPTTPASDATSDASANTPAKSWPVQGSAPIPDPERTPVSHVSVIDDFAVRLAYTLDDMANLPCYDALVDRIMRRKVLPRGKHLNVPELMLRKARQCASLREPHGPLRNPAAVFTAWAKRLR